MRPLLPHFIQEQYEAKQYNGQFTAVTLFVDVSGFTSLTQTLMEKGGEEGAEILSTTLNHFFAPMVNLVYQAGGFISTFAGDAFTAIFPEPAHVLAILTCVVDIQQFFQVHGYQVTPFGTFQLNVKIGLAIGQVDYGIIGKEEITGNNSKHYFFRGEAINACAYAEHHANKGDIILDALLQKLIPPHILTVQVVEEGYCRLIELHKTARIASNQAVPIKENIARKFLPKSIVNFPYQGEFRRVVSIFISFKGVENLTELDCFVSIVLKYIGQYDGNLNAIDFGDKGGVLVCFFGAPITHENDISRALSFMLDIKEKVKAFSLLKKLKIRAGITVGQAYAGILGGEERCHYTSLGTVVNLAARFMAKAHWHQLLTSQAISSEGRKFSFLKKGEFRYKGISYLVPTYAFLKRKSQRLQPAFNNDMVGREQELQELIQVISPIFLGEFAGISYIFGDAGIGKSRLVYEVREELGNKVSWFFSGADPILSKPFHVFQTFLAHYFKQQKELSIAKNKVIFERRYNILVQKLKTHFNINGSQRLLLELARTKSILAAQIGLYDKNSLWHQLDAKGRYENTLYALKNLFLAESLLQPVVIQLDDIQWFDKESIRVVELLLRKMDSYPIALLATARYHDDGSRPTIKAPDYIPQQQIDLQYLSSAALKDFVAQQLGESVDDQLFELLVQKTKGNPFFAQQMISYFLEEQVISRKDEVWQLKQENVTIPATINAILIARIDRLSQQVKDVVKVAAVIGQEFEIGLVSNILKKKVVVEIKAAEQSQIWDIIKDLRGVFQHALLRDAAYSMQLKARLRALHEATAQALEVLYDYELTSEEGSSKFADIAFHFEQSHNISKTIEYLQKAANYARHLYQNQQALSYYNKLWMFVHDKKDVALKIKILLEKATILRSIGFIRQAKFVYEDIKKMYDQHPNITIGVKGYNGLASCLMMMGKVPEAMALLDYAMLVYQQKNQPENVLMTLGSIGHVHRLQGNSEKSLFFYESYLQLAKKQGNTKDIITGLVNVGVFQTRAGKYEIAMGHLIEALSLVEEKELLLELAVILGSIANIHLFQGNLTQSMSYNQQKLALVQELGYRQKIARTLGNIGHIYLEQGQEKKALENFEQCLHISQELDNQRDILISWGNIGQVYIKGEDYEKAMLAYQNQQELATQLKSQKNIANSLGNMGSIHFALGQYEQAKANFQQCLTIFEQLRIKPLYAFYQARLAAIYAKENSLPTALSLYETAYQTLTKIGHKRYQYLVLKDNMLCLLQHEKIAAANTAFATLTKLMTTWENTEAQVEVKILAGQIARFNKDTTTAKQLLQELLQQELPFKYQAIIHFELWKNSPEPIQWEHQKRAIDLYKHLYQQTKAVEYKEKLAELV